MMMKLDEIWTELEKEAQLIFDAGILKRMLDPDAACTLFLGVERPSLKRLLILQYPYNLRLSQEQIPESRGFELTVQNHIEGSQVGITFVLSATNNKYNELFSSMADNLYKHLKLCKDEKQSARIFLDRLNEWQLFFERMSLDGLSEESQRGLYGELFFLKHHLLSEPNFFFEEISAWTGPKNRQHDFQFGTAAVEVKTSSAKRHQKLFISSEQQLDETLTGGLFVFHLSLSILENFEATLPSLVGQLREKLSSISSAALLFEESLLQRGYCDSQSWRYQRTGYSIRENNLFRVSGSFPRITERDLPVGVGDLSYSISVDECKKFITTFDELNALIRQVRL